MQRLTRCQYSSKQWLRLWKRLFNTTVRVWTRMHGQDFIVQISISKNGTTCSQAYLVPKCRPVASHSWTSLIILSFLCGSECQASNGGDWVTDSLPDIARSQKPDGLKFQRANTQLLLTLIMSLIPLKWYYVRRVDKRHSSNFHESFHSVNFDIFCLSFDSRFCSSTFLIRSIGHLVVWPWIPFRVIARVRILWQYASEQVFLSCSPHRKITYIQCLDFSFDNQTGFGKHEKLNFKCMTLYSKFKILMYFHSKIFSESGRR